MNYFIFSIWPPAAILDFRNYPNFVLKTYILLPWWVLSNHLSKFVDFCWKRIVKKRGFFLFCVSRWRPAAILNLTSKLKFDSRNEIGRLKTFGKYILQYFLRFTNSWIWDIYHFQYGRRRPSWILEITQVFSWGLIFYSIIEFRVIKIIITAIYSDKKWDSRFLVIF